MGKGTIGINPFYHDRQIMSRPAIAGLLSVIVSFTNARSCELLMLAEGVLADSLQVVLGTQSWMLYWLVTAMYPQFLITLDEELAEKEVTVRVGQAVNTVGLAGTRMGISGVSVFLGTA
jgi:26S proteasome regulatory subunit N1